MYMVHSDRFSSVISAARRLLLGAPIVDVGEWQSIRGDIAQARTAEVQDFSFEYFLPGSVHELQEDVRPNLPWAEDHFAERVGGEPLNPPPSEAYWPFRQREGNVDHKRDEKFSHTYPERLWPKRVEGIQRHVGLGLNQGLRYQLGDLDDVVALLNDSRHTRQAFIPIWFPEDTGAAANQRVPCTIGYHILIRDNRLKIVYYMRSCDYIRHFRDDVYMAARLAQWVSLRLHYAPAVDRLVMHISSLHVFEVDLPRLRSAERLEADVVA